MLKQGKICSKIKTIDKIYKDDKTFNNAVKPKDKANMKNKLLRSKIIYMSCRETYTSNSKRMKYGEEIKIQAMKLYKRLYFIKICKL